MTRNTSEQQAVIDSRAEVLAIDAFAGTGKTSTLVQYAAARPKERMLHEGDRVWGGSVERSCEPMDKNRIKGGADQGERAKDREALVIKGQAA